METTLWPWLVIAGAGALHGLNPASGWACAAAWSLCACDRAVVMRALLPIALGHGVSLVLVAGAATRLLPLDRGLMQVLAGASLLVVLVLHLPPLRRPNRSRVHATQAGVALGSFLMSSLHGAGLMLVPALMPLCGGDASAGASGSLLPALAAAVLHTVAMLAVTGAMASGVCRMATRARPTRGQAPAA